MQAKDSEKMEIKEVAVFSMLMYILTATKIRLPGVIVRQNLIRFRLFRYAPCFLLRGIGITRQEPAYHSVNRSSIANWTKTWIQG